MRKISLGDASQVRSLTLDVRVWDAPVMALMAALGNAAANAVWEEALRRVSAQADSWVRPWAPECLEILSTYERYTYKVIYY